MTSRVLPLQRILGALAVVALWLALVSLPSAPAADLDVSWQEVLIHAHNQGWQSGRDVIFTWGPLAYLFTAVHLGAAAAGKRIAWETAGKLLFSAGLGWLTRRLPAWRRLLFFCAAILLTGFFLDAIYYAAVALAGLELVADEPGGRPVRLRRRILVLCGYAALLGALAFLAQAKFTYLLIGAAVVWVAAGLRLLRGRWAEAFLLVAAHAAAFVGIWAACGQNPDNVVPYLRRGFSLSTGYSAAMGLEAPDGILLLGTACAGLCGLFLLQLARHSADRLRGWAVAGVVGVVGLVMWKEGFIRADGHALGFFVLVVLLWPVLPAPGVPPGGRLCLAAAGALALSALAVLSGGALFRTPAATWARAVDNAGELCAWRSLPARWEAEKDSARAGCALPRIRLAVGDAPVDVFNFNQGAALLNGLNYHPRPVFQSYTAYTPSLEGWNLRFYHSAKAPPYILWFHGSIDDRVPSMDDALLLPSIIRNYRPVLEENGCWLFRRQTGLPPVGLFKEWMAETDLEPGQVLEVPRGPRRAVWLQVEALPTELGRLRSLLYKPAELFLFSVDELGRRHRGRVLPEVSAVGFLLDPYLETGGDLAGFMQGRVGPRVRSIRFEGLPGQNEFWRRFRVRLFALPELTISAETTYRELVDAGVLEGSPTGISLSATLDLSGQADGSTALLLPAPGRMDLPVPARAGRFSGRFGLRADAYSGDGATEGVRFSVEALWADGRRRELWQRFLDPVHCPADRGPQAFDVGVPADRPERLSIVTTAGPFGDAPGAPSWIGTLRFRPRP